MKETSKPVFLSLIALVGLAACSSKSENISVVKKSGEIIILDKEADTFLGGEKGYEIRTRKAEKGPTPSYQRKVEPLPGYKTIAIQRSSVIKTGDELDSDELKQLESGVNNSRYLYYSGNPFRIGRIRLKRFK